MVLVRKSTGAGSTGTIRDALLGSAIRPSHDLTGNWIRIPYATGGAPEGEISQITYVDTDTGDIHLSPPLSAATTSGMPYEIWLHHVDPDVVDQCRDIALQNTCSRWARYPVTLVPDGDLNSETASYFYNYGGSQVTIAYQYDEKFRGSIVATIGAAGGTKGISTSTFPVRTTDTLFIALPVKASTPATVTVSLVDTSDYSVLASSNTPVSADWTWCLLSGGPKTSTANVCIRVTYTPTVTGTLSIGPISCYAPRGYAFWLPDHVETSADVGQIFEMDPMTLTFRELFGYRETLFGGTVRVTLAEGMLGSYPLFYEKRAFYRPLQTDYSTAAGRKAGDQALTDCPLQYAAEATAFSVAVRMSRQDPLDDYWRTQTMDLTRTMVAAESRYGAQPKFVKNISKQYVVPQIKV